MTRAWFALVIASGFVFFSLACASILELKDLPLAGPDGASSSSDGAPLDAGADVCAPRGTSFCQRLCPAPDFCDDFEGTKLAENWDPPFGAQNPILSGGGSVFLARDDAGEQSQVLIAEANSTSADSDTAVIATTLDRALRKRKVRGVHITADVHPRSLSFGADAGPAPGTLSFLAYGSQALNLGVGILLVDEPPDDLRLVLQQRALGGKGDRFELADVVTVPRRTVFINKLPVDLYVARPDVLREQNVVCSLVADAGDDAGGDTDMRVLLRVGSGTPLSKCAAFRGELATTDWLNSTVLFVGAAVSDFSSASVRIDNVTVTFFE